MLLLKEHVLDTKNLGGRDLAWLKRQTRWEARGAKAAQRPICMKCAAVTDSLFRRTKIKPAEGATRNAYYTFEAVTVWRWCPECGPVDENMTMSFTDLVSLTFKARQKRNEETLKGPRSPKWTVPSRKGKGGKKAVEIPNGID